MYRHFVFSMTWKGRKREIAGGLFLFLLERLIGEGKEGLVSFEAVLATHNRRRFPGGRGKLKSGVNLIMNQLQIMGS